ncbi:conserved hypothetical protein [Clostridium botulinum A3 str. Loch Maree]|nr:conserved hypothetical protein [Clostridium botulinum A3 str. Loch Maree]
MLLAIIEKNNIKFDVIKNDYIFLIFSLCSKLKIKACLIYTLGIDEKKFKNA